ncbi:Alpha/Beta hydrolase protein [Dactylonectria estremocensis]|uniref:Alpha/Beta hydrolase protein n=1 Tax=Dactylonectria estremocensis TaxID=1079267 RepID=A0A9P9ISG8_9HYPO|nr:Alpha/Beta hydrolase protein [Dactylonectria estremocensis]
MVIQVLLARRAEIKKGLQQLHYVYSMATQFENAGTKAAHLIFDANGKPQWETEQIAKWYTNVTDIQFPNSGKLAFMPSKVNSSIYESAKQTNIIIRGTKFIRDISISTGKPWFGFTDWLLGFTEGESIEMSKFLGGLLKPGQGVSQFAGKVKRSFAESLKQEEVLVNPVTGKPYGTLPSMLMQILAQYESYAEGDDIAIYGHSMGGGIAQIVGYILAMGPKKFKSITVVVAGSVKVFDKVAMNALKEKGVVFFNFVAQGDPVPYLWDLDFVEPRERISFIPNVLDFVDALEKHGIVSYLAPVYDDECVKACYFMSEQGATIDNMVPRRKKEALLKM